MLSGENSVGELLRRANLLASLYCPTLHCNETVDSVISQEATRCCGISVAATLFRVLSGESLVGELLRRDNLLALLVLPNPASQ